MDVAFYLLLAGILAAAIIGAVVRTWSIHTRLYSLEDRLSLVEGIIQREVKVRAATERWKRPTKDEERVVEALYAAPQSKTPKNWWETDLPRRFP